MHCNTKPDYKHWYFKTLFSVKTFYYISVLPHPPLPLSCLHVDRGWLSTHHFSYNKRYNYKIYDITSYYIWYYIFLLHQGAPPPPLSCLHVDCSWFSIHRLVITRNTITSTMRLQNSLFSVKTFYYIMCATLHPQTAVVPLIW